MVENPYLHVVFDAPSRGGAADVAVVMTPDQLKSLVNLVVMDFFPLGSFV